MKLVVTDQVHLSEFCSSDKDALLAHLDDRDIYERTLRIPFPYTDAAADEWLVLVGKITQQQGRPVQWAIRNADALIGGCGFDGFQVGKSHWAEVGYWLAKQFWGRGIMTAVVQRVCRHAFEELGLAKITAHVFPHNPASARVLEKWVVTPDGFLPGFRAVRSLEKWHLKPCGVTTEKCGFQEEGFLRKHFLKDGQFIDARLFALLC